MMSVSFSSNTLVVGDVTLSLQYAIRDAFVLDDKIIVLLDPDSYLTAPTYRQEQRRGERSVQNLLAISNNGQLLWEAEFPEKADYYYRVVSRQPLTALSFSSYRCEIDPRTGKIIAKQFLK